MINFITISTVMKIIIFKIKTNYVKNTIYFKFSNIKKFKILLNILIIFLLKMNRFYLSFDYYSTIKLILFYFYY